MSILEAISPTAKELLTNGVTKFHVQAANWNGTHNIGTPVQFTKDDGTILETVTASQAWVSANRHSAVIKIVDVEGPQFLSRVQAIKGRQP